MQTVTTLPKLYVASRRQDSASLPQKPAPQKSHLALSTNEGIRLIPVQDIIRVESDGNYCTIHCHSGQKFLASRTLRVVECMLPHLLFARVHKSHLIRIDQISVLLKEEILLTTGDRLPLSRQQRGSLIEKLQSFSAKL